MARDRALTGAQKAAVFILHMGKDRSVEVLRSMRETEVAEIMAEVARMRTVNGTVVEEVVSEFKEMADAKVTITAGGLERARTLLEESLGGDKATEMADEVRQRMFVFEDIAGLDDRSIQLVLRQVDSKELAVALKGVRQEVRNAITRNMSERAGANLVEEIALLGAVRLKTVEEAQGAIVRVVRALEESGQLVLVRSADEFVE